MAREGEAKITLTRRPSGMFVPDGAGPGLVVPQHVVDDMKAEAERRREAERPRLNRAQRRAMARKVPAEHRREYAAGLKEAFGAGPRRQAQG